MNPLVTAGAADGSVTNFIASATLDTTADYAGIIEIRVKDSGPGGIGSGTKYWETNISYTLTDPVAGTGTWTVNDPTAQPTTTTLTANPASPLTSPPGAAVQLDALVAPASNGTVKFMEGATQIGATQNVTTVSGAAQVTIAAPGPSVGSHSYTAVFTPAGGTLAMGSTSSILTYLVQAPAIGTTTVLAINTGTGIADGVNPVQFTGNVTAADSSTPTGTVTFKEGAVTIGTSSSHDSSTPFTFSTTALSAGLHSNVTATFTPASNAYNSSVSTPAQSFTLTAPACPAGTCDAQTITADIPAGTLVIATPYTATNPLDVPLVLDVHRPDLLHRSGRVQRDPRDRHPRREPVLDPQGPVQQPGQRW